MHILSFISLFLSTHWYWWLIGYLAVYVLSSKYIEGKFRNYYATRGKSAEYILAKYNIFLVFLTVLFFSLTIAILILNPWPLLHTGHF